MTFEIPVTYTCPFSGTVDAREGTFLVHAGRVGVIRGGQGSQRLADIDFAADLVKFGKHTVVDSDVLRFALEERGL